MVGTWLVGALAVGGLLCDERVRRELSHAALERLLSLLTSPSALGRPRCMPSGVLSYTLAHALPALDTLASLILASQPRP